MLGGCSFFDRIEIQRVWVNVLLVGPHDRPVKRLNAFEIGKVIQLNEDAETQERLAVIDADFAVRESEGQGVIIVGGYFYNSRVHNYLRGSILYGCCPLTASCQLAINSSW